MEACLDLGGVAGVAEFWKAVEDLLARGGGDGVTDSLPAVFQVLPQVRGWQGKAWLAIPEPCGAGWH